MLSKEKKTIKVIREIKRTLTSKPFRKELEDLSLYAANIKQERQIIGILAKLLVKRKSFDKISMEKKVSEKSKEKNDLCVDDEIRVEAKYNFDWDIEKLDNEMTKFGYEANKAVRKVMRKRDSWGISYGVIKDIILKKPDIFMWIIVERDIEMARQKQQIEKIDICLADQQRKSRVRDFDVIVDKFFRSIKTSRKFDLYKISIKADNRYFESRYHFFVLNFTKSRG